MLVGRRLLVKSEAALADSMRWVSRDLDWSGEDATNTETSMEIDFGLGELDGILGQHNLI